MLIDLSWNQIVNYLVISWCDVKGTLTRCLGQTLGRQGGDRGRQVDTQYFVGVCCWRCFVHQGCAPLAIQPNLLTFLSLH